MITFIILTYLVNNKEEWVQGTGNSLCPLYNYFCKYIFQLLGWGDSSVVKVPYKHEDLSSIPKTHVKKPGLVAQARNLSAGKVEKYDSLRLAVLTYC